MDRYVCHQYNSNACEWNCKHAPAGVKIGTIEVKMHIKNCMKTKYTHIWISGVLYASIHTPLDVKLLQLIISLVLPISWKWGGSIRRFLRRRRTGPMGAYNQRRGDPLPPENLWDPSSFIFYRVPLASQLFPRLHHPCSNLDAPPPPCFFFHYNRNVIVPFYGGVTNIYPKRKRVNNLLDVKSNIIFFLFGV